MRTRLGTKPTHDALQDNDEDAAPNTRANNWHMWCRLCAKEDPEGNIYVLLKNEQSGHTATSQEFGEKMSISVGESSNYNLCLAESVQKYFCIQITSDDVLPKVLCTECFSLVTSLVNFSERVAKVQQMFLTLKNSSEDSQVDTHIIRLKYGLLDEERGNLFIHKPMPEVHYLETTINKLQRQDQEPDEVPIMNPLEPLNPLEPHIKIKIKKEKIQADVPDEDRGQDISDNDGDGSFDNEDDLLFTKAPSESSDSEQLDDTSNAECKREFRKLKKLDIKESTKPYKLQKRQYMKESKKNCDEVLPCTDCPRTFKGLKGLARHMIKAHSKRLPAVEASCTQCPRIFKSQYKLKKHLKTHLPNEEKKEVPCSYCDEKFSMKLHLQAHLKVVHPDERPFICEKCGAGKRTRGALKEHMLTHTDYAPFKCEVCQRGFKDKYQLKRHKDTHDPKKHICAICGMQLNTRANLRDHLLVHSDKMRHKCDYCGRAFKRANNLKSHLISHTGIKPYSCNFCDRAFSNSANCRLHVKKIHPEEALIGIKMYTLKKPRLDTLKAISKTADNLAPVPSGPACKADASKIPNFSLDLIIPK